MFISKLELFKMAEDKGVMSLEISYQALPIRLFFDGKIEMR